MTDDDTEIYDELLARFIAERMFKEMSSRSTEELKVALRAIAERHKRRLVGSDSLLSDEDTRNKEAAAIARLEEEGYRVVPLTHGGYVVVDVACPPGSAECSNLDELLVYCAEVLEETQTDAR